MADIAMLRCLPLFGILSCNQEDESMSEESCHFCLETVKDNDIYAMSTPCCGHLIHCSCFKRWLRVRPHHISCAYCRRRFSMNEHCFLCLKKRGETEVLRRTSCCQGVVHQECLETVHELIQEMPEDAGFTCEHSLACNRVLVQSK